MKQDSLKCSDGRRRFSDELIQLEREKNSNFFLEERAQTSAGRHKKSDARLLRRSVCVKKLW